jgi:hypothetical protein
MKVTLLKPKSIRGVLEKKGTVVDVSEGVAEWLIERGDAETPKAKKSET